MQPLWLYFFLLFFLRGRRVDLRDMPPASNPVGCAICSVRADGPQNGRGCQLFAEVSQQMDINIILEFVKLTNQQFKIKQQGGRNVWPNS